MNASLGPTTPQIFLSELSSASGLNVKECRAEVEGADSFSSARHIEGTIFLVQATASAMVLIWSRENLQPVLRRVKCSARNGRNEVNFRCLSLAAKAAAGQGEQACAGGADSTQSPGHWAGPW